jgi:hypothetical protein
MLLYVEKVMYCRREGMPTVTDVHTAGGEIVNQEF